MIHILTVHWWYDKWVDIQLQYLQKHVCVPYKAYAFLNLLKSDHSEKYFYSTTEYIKSHATKLNLLADMATLHSVDDTDWLMFLDGDAFPIGDVVEFSAQKLASYDLLAVQRKENAGDIQPHPCFCVMTVGTWKRIKGDWRVGEWTNVEGKKVEDVGGRVLAKIDEHQLTWYPMLRSNATNLHGLFFGLYDKIIYHHGAGFREPISRWDSAQENISERQFNIYLKYLKNLPRAVKKSLNPVPAVIERNKELSSQVFASIERDAEFYRQFQ